MKRRRTPSTDPVRLKKRHERQNLLFVTGGLILIGSALIGLIYGWLAALVAIPLLMAGALLVLGVYGVLVLIERAVGEDR